MKYSEENFNIELKDSTLIFSGKMEKSNYSDVITFLNEASTNISNEDINLDIKKLNFLNSSGIRMLATFFMKSSKTFTIYIDTSITWQKVGIVPLSRIKKEGEIKVIS